VLIISDYISSQVSFAVIAHIIEQHGGFGSTLTPENRILPLGVNFPLLGTTVLTTHLQLIATSRLFTQTLL